MRVLCGVLLVFVVGPLLQAQTTKFPDFCGQPSAADLKAVSPPYQVLRRLGDGSSYCEGILPQNRSIAAPAVISVKQRQENMQLTGMTKITWCGDSHKELHVQLRSIEEQYALDAKATGGFEWQMLTSLVGRYSWEALAAKGMLLPNRDVLFPLRTGDGYSSQYIFLIESETPIALQGVTIQPAQGKVPVPFRGQPVPGVDNLYRAEVSFASVQNGVYSVIFEGETGGNRILRSKPVVINHMRCSDSQLQKTRSTKAATVVSPNK